jgi:hypothetical protein
MDFEDDSPSAAEGFYAQCFRKKRNQPEGSSGSGHGVLAFAQRAF